MSNQHPVSPSGSPVVRDMRVVPVAGRDSMLLNLSGAHGPYFTRNLLILTDSAGNTGVGEVPGGEAIRQTLEDARPLLIGQADRPDVPVFNTTQLHVDAVVDMALADETEHSHGQSVVGG